MLMYGPVDLGRLNNSEGDHKEYAKDAARHTRRHYRTQMGEMHAPIDRYEAMHAANAYERRLGDFRPILRLDTHFYCAETLYIDMRRISRHCMEECVSRRVLCGLGRTNRSHPGGVAVSVPLRAH